MERMESLPEYNKEKIAELSNSIAHTYFTQLHDSEKAEIFYRKCISLLEG